MMYDDLPDLSARLTELRQLPDMRLRPGRGAAFWLGCAAGVALLLAGACWGYGRWHGRGADSVETASGEAPAEDGTDG
jgi:hypothetical protein